MFWKNEQEIKRLSKAVNVLKKEMYKMKYPPKPLGGYGESYMSKGTIVRVNDNDTYDKETGEYLFTDYSYDLYDEEFKKLIERVYFY